MRHHFWIACLAGLLVLGCSNRYKPVPVSGVVTLEGKPVEGATVQFYSVGDEREGRQAFGSTDKDGKFRLSTMGNDDGALPGDYKVVIARWVPADPGVKIPDFPNTPEGKAQRDDFEYKIFGETKPRMKNLLPAKYSNPSETPLRVTVKGETTEKFDLKKNP
jgi:hypothetical protein